MGPRPSLCAVLTLTNLNPVAKGQYMKQRIIKALYGNTVPTWCAELQVFVTAIAVLWSIPELYVIVPAVVFIGDNLLYRALRRRGADTAAKEVAQCLLADRHDGASLPMLCFVVSCIFLLHIQYVITAVLCAAAALMYQQTIDDVNAYGGN